MLTESRVQIIMDLDKVIINGKIPSIPCPVYTYIVPKYIDANSTIYVYTNISPYVTYWAYCKYPTQ